MTLNANCFVLTGVKLLLSQYCFPAGMVNKLNDDMLFTLDSEGPGGAVISLLHEQRQNTARQEIIRVFIGRIKAPF